MGMLVGVERSPSTRVFVLFMRYLFMVYPGSIPMPASVRRGLPPSDVLVGLPLSRSLASGPPGGERFFWNMGAAASDLAADGLWRELLRFFWDSWRHSNQPRPSAGWRWVAGVCALLLFRGARHS